MGTVHVAHNVAAQRLEFFSEGSIGFPFPAPAMSSFSRQLLPTDPIGTFTLTLTNLVVGSAIQVEDQTGVTTFYNGVAAGTSQDVNLQAYAPGSPLNDLRIKVRKGTSAPYHKPWDTQATAIIGSQSIYVAQIADE